MESKMQRQIIAVVKKNLPENVAREMKLFIESSKADKEKLIAAEKRIALLEKSLGKQYQKISAFEEKVRVYGKLEDEKNELVNIREQLRIGNAEQDVFELRAKLDASEMVADKIGTFMINMSRNTVYKRRFAGDVVAGVDPGHCDENGTYYTGSAMTANVKNETTVVESDEGSEG